MASRERWELAFWALPQQLALLEVVLWELLLGRLLSRMALAAIIPWREA